MHKHQILPQEWEKEVEHWLDWLKAAGCSDATLTTRYYKISYLARLLHCGPMEVTGQALVHVCATQPWKRETLKGYTNTIRSFYRYLIECDDDDIDVDPTRALPRVRKQRSIPHPCPDSLVHQALDKATIPETVMIKLASECGLRRSEIAQVSSHDVITINKHYYLLVHGKGAKERTVPVSAPLAHMVENAHGYVFPGRFHGHVESSYISKHVSRLLGHGYSTHSLRHRYATTLYAYTHDILLVSKLLGHESIDTTQTYLALTITNPTELITAVTL